MPHSWKAASLSRSSLWLSHNTLVADFPIQYCSYISAPSLGVYYFLSLTLSVRLSVCLSQTLSSFLVSRWNRAVFGHQFSMTKTTNLFSSIFDLGPLTPKIYSPKFSSVGHWVSHSLWVIVCGSTTFGLGAEIQSPTGLFKKENTNCTSFHSHQQRLHRLCWFRSCLQISFRFSTRQHAYMLSML